jgi:hypothetical protein
MDMSDGGTAAARTPSAVAADGERWREVVTEVGSEVAAPLTGALDRIDALVATGRIDKANLRALREEVATARRTGMLAQQLIRFASSPVRQTHERLALADMLNRVVDERAGDRQPRGIAVKASLKPVDVLVDPSLLFGLLDAMVEWTLSQARSPIEFSIDMKAWPVHARLRCHFAYRAADAFDAHGATPAPVPALDSLAWRLVEQTAWAMGLPLTRTIRGGDVRLVLEFPRTAAEPLEGVSAVDLHDGLELSGGTRPLAGSHVLVVASRRDMRVRIRDAIRHIGLVIDLVASVDEARDFCRDSLPHAIIVEGILSGERLTALRSAITAQVPDFPFIEIVEEGGAFAMSGFGGAPMGRVGREAIESALPSVLMFELSRTL